jgi:hypothetical protein
MVGSGREADCVRGRCAASWAFGFDPTDSCVFGTSRAPPGSNSSAFHFAAPTGVRLHVLRMVTPPGVLLLVCVHFGKSPWA